MAAALTAALAVALAVSLSVLLASAFIVALAVALSAALATVLTATLAYTYKPCELFDHFIKVVLPLANENGVTDGPPVELPGLPTLYWLGTRSQDCIYLEIELKHASTEFRLRVMKKRDQLEDNEYGDELYEMHQTLWPVEALRDGDLANDKLFEYKVEDQLPLQWYQGKVTEFVSERIDTHVIVKVKWNAKCLRDGDPTITREKLMWKSWNPKEQSVGACRQDLYDKILKIK